MRRTVPLLCLCVVVACDRDDPKVTAPSAAPTASATSTTSSSGATSPPSSWNPPAPPARPLYYARAITAADLQGRTLRELSLLRNTIYARAGNSFRRPWLDEHFRAKAWYKPQAKMDPAKITPLDKSNARLIADHDASLTRKQLERMRDHALRRRKHGWARPGDPVELSLLSQRLGTWLGGAAKGRPATPLEDPTQLDRLVTVEGLSTLSRRDLRILRNTIYARRGRTFESKVVRGYFAAATWYRPRADYDDSLLNGIDQKNIAIVRSVEDSLGGPLHENPDYGKDGWFFAA